MSYETESIHPVISFMDELSNSVKKRNDANNVVSTINNAIMSSANGNNHLLVSKRSIDQSYNNSKYKNNNKRYQTNIRYKNSV